MNVDARGLGRWVVLAGVLLSGCMVGQTADTFTPATGPQGVGSNLQFPSFSAWGELLAVANDGLYVLTPVAVPGQPGRNTLLFGRWDRLLSASFDQMGVRLREGKPPSDKDRDKLTRVARFPQGLSPELLGDVLAAYGLEEVYVPGAEPVAEPGEE